MARYLIVALDRDIAPADRLGIEKVDGMLLVHSGDQMARITRVVTVVPGETLEQRLDAIVQGVDDESDAA